MRSRPPHGARGPPPLSLLAAHEGNLPAAISNVPYPAEIEEIVQSRR